MTQIEPVYSSHEVLDFTRKMTQHVIDNKIDGDLIECGVAAGSQIAMMQRTLLENRTSRTIWALDSYEGIPYATDKDTQQPGIGNEVDKTKLGLLETTGVSAHSLESVKINFQRYQLPIDNIEFVKGWFEYTVKPTAKQIKKIALLRLDGDLYRSTQVCMKHLYPKLSKGGVLIIDDIQLDGCRAAIEEYINPKELTYIHGIAYYIR